MPSPHLRLVVAPAPRPAAAAAPPSVSDLGLVCAILAVALVPLAGVLAGAQFSPGETGAGAAIALLSGREALRTARALCGRRA